MSELEFKKFGKGIIINDGSKKGFGSIKPLTNTDQKGNKFQVKINSGIPKEMLNDPKNVGVKTKRVKSITEGKKVANKIFKIGGGSDLPIKLEQGPDVVKDKNKFNSGGIVNFKGVF
mgnify:FL=1|jgi:hypothetical protein|tara:strand:+ start:209 stop:559 length:351 start_codon:yes stop_codon:yes gene_type:complete